MNLKTLIAAYQNLEPEEKWILQLLAVAYLPLTQTNINNVLATLSKKISKKTYTRLDKSLRERLLNQGLIHRRGGRIQCESGIACLLAGEVASHGYFHAMKDAVESDDFAETTFLPGSWRFDHQRYQRALHHAVHGDDISTFMRLLEINDPYEEPSLYYQNYLIEVVGQPFYSEVFLRWHPAVQYQAIMPLLESCIIKWDDPGPFLSLLDKAIAGDKTGGAHLKRMRVEFAILRGEWDRLDQLAQGMDEQSAALTIAMHSYFKAPHNALENFEIALAALRKRTRKRPLALPGLAETLYLFLLIGEPSEQNTSSIEQQAKAVRRRDYSNIYFDVIIEVLHAHGVYKGMSEETYSHDDTLQEPHPFITLVMALPWYWNCVEPEPGLLASLERAGERAQSNGYRWLAWEIGCLLLVFRGETVPPEGFGRNKPLLELLPRIERWEKSLQALASIGTLARTQQSAAQTRIVWMLANDQSLSLTPKEQRIKKNGGWTAGRNVALRRFVENDPTLSWTPADRQIANAIKVYTGYYYNSADYVLEGPEAIQAAARHPLVFRKDGGHVQINKGEPELIVRRRDDQIHLSLQPYPVYDKELLIVEETPLNIIAYNYDEPLREVAYILGPEGLTVPNAAEQGVLKSVSVIAPLLTVHSDIAGLSDTTAEELPADRRLYVQLYPVDSGMRVNFLVRPFSKGPRLTPGQGGERVFAEIDGRSVTTGRDLAGEATLLAKVLDACPTLYQPAPGEWRWDETEAALEGLLVLKSMDDELVLEWPEGRSLTLTEAVGVSSMSISMREQTDWFEVEGSLKVSEQQVYSMSSLLKLLDNREGRFLRMEDGQFLTLTDSLRRRLDLMRHLEDGGKVHALHSENLEACVEGMDVDADKAWRAQIERLAQAREVEPVLPTTVDADLRDYQLQGFKWLCRLASWGAGACLADDMGLGKTLQALALLVTRAQGGPALVIAPTSVCANWLEEAERFTPTLNVTRFGDGDRSVVLASLGPYDVLVCTYGLLQSERQSLQAVHWHSIVADEAQAFKNMATKRSKAMMGLHGDFRMIATGTPIENHLGELWNLFNFINPGLLGSLDTFNQKFAYAIENRYEQAASRALKQLISPFILRRLKRDVLTELPPITEISVKVELSKEEQALYEALRREAVDQLADSDLAPNQQRIEILASITRLRQAVCNPNLVLKEGGLKSSKLSTFAAIVAELRENRHHALVFSQFVAHLSLIREYLDGEGISYRYLDGRTPVKRRREEVDAFQEGKADLFLISLRAGGVGLNLTAADYVIHMDPWWNPAVEDQASDRAHRIGQHRPVTVYRLVASDTIEEKIVELHATKRDLATSLLEGTEASARMSVDDMMALLQVS